LPVAVLAAAVAGAGHGLASNLVGEDFR